jgi:hypothetical protein
MREYPYDYSMQKYTYDKLVYWYFKNKWNPANNKVEQQ